MSELAKHIESLTPVRSGERIGDALNAQRINAIQESIRILAKGGNIVTGRGVRKRELGIDAVSINAQGRGRQSVSLIRPLTLVTSPSPFHNQSKGDEFYVRMGVVNNVLPYNLSNGFVSAGEYTYVYVKAALDLAHADLVTSAQIVVSAAPILNTAFDSEGNPPSEIHMLIGAVQKKGGALSLSNFGAGSLSVTITISQITCAAGETTMYHNLSWWRHGAYELLD
jgi:hypothetical protein